ncbi:type IV pilus modification PilV family protein [Planococcus salinarum]|uniref:type IV pilus modification PilV family protein n=1 Tax=Planococcus salinarum TaxID=622695 RepID=UPI000E3DCFB8|nr:type II secretion system protein [Planococcus salinarum]TAA70476.1 type II secretion system protein [Planococcus salinarum]
MKKFWNGQQGMTLVELLAAIALLGIVLFTFMSIFTQSAKFSAHNQETLTAVQVAEDIVAEVRTGTYSVSEDFTRNEYDIELVIEDGPENLKVATITVKSPEGVGINEPEFTTHMYFEGSAP